MKDVILMPLVAENSPILKEKIEDFDFSKNSKNAYNIYMMLKKALIEYGGVGLAANQIGMRHRVFVFGDANYPDSIACAFNPKIVDEFGKDVYMTEGCLSYPNLFIKIKRPSCIRVRYSNYDGAVKTIKYEGLTARIFQHELDHLNGLTFHDRSNRFHLEMAKKKKKKIIKNLKNA